MRGQGLFILTPEHVQIRLMPAGMGSRFVAWLVDTVLIGAIAALMFVICLGFMGQTIGSFVYATLLFVVMWGYHILFDLLWQGRTPGKRVAGLRVVDDRGLPIGLQQSFVRNIVRILDMQPLVFYGFGALVCLFNREHRRLGDIAAGTIVVRETSALAYPGRVAEGRQFNSLRTPRVMRLMRNRIGLEEREFLLSLCLRAPKMDDKRRFDLMEEVGENYRAKLEIDDPHLSGENLVRGLTAVLFEKKAE